ncbi:IS66 family insertion sequence element accessory protein TnpA [Francisella frigiditurris]
MSYYTSKEQNETEWNERIKDFLASGISRAEYCAKNNLNTQTLLD